MTSRKLGCPILCGERALGSCARSKGGASRIPIRCSQRQPPDPEKFALTFRVYDTWISPSNRLTILLRFVSIMRRTSVQILILLLAALYPLLLGAQEGSQSAAPDAVATSPLTSPSTPEAQDAWAKGQEFLFRKHDPAASIESFRKVVELEPAFVPGYILLGNACLQAQDLAQAKSAYEKAAKLEPGNSVAFLGIGSVLNQQHEWLAAQKPLQRSLELKPDSAEAHYEMGRSLVAQGRLQDAEPYVRRCIEINKDYAVPHILMGDLYLHLHRNVNAALGEYQQYLQLEPHGAAAQSVKDIISRLEKLQDQK